MSFKKQFRSFFLKILFKIIARRDAKRSLPKLFPVCLQKNFFYDPLNIEGRNYHMKYFMERMPNPLRIDFSNFRGEILPGKLIPGHECYDLFVDSPSVLPVCLTNSEFSQGQDSDQIFVRFNDHEYNLRKLVKDRFYHLKLDQQGSVNVTASDDFIIGDPIALTQKKKTRYKLVLCIFVDSLTWALLKDRPLKETLPNIDKFFSKGTIFENCYTWGNWTLTSAPCITTGLNIKNHGLFHPNKNDPLRNSYKIMSEYYQDAGYLTFQSCGNWRKTPAYGYVRGFDRSIFKAEMGTEETIYPFIDQLRAFPHRSHFAWMSLNDAHLSHAARLTAEISVQTRLNISDHDYLEKTPPKERGPIPADPAQSARYAEEMKLIDFNLGILFSYIKDNYDDDEFLVSLVSDHGVNYLTGEQVSLTEGETHTAMMLRGGGVPAKKAEELIQNIDLLPSMLHFSNIETPTNLDGIIPTAFGGKNERKMVMTEVIYPGKPYRASVKTKSFDLQYTSSLPTDEDGNTNTKNSKFELYKGGDYSIDVSEDYAKNAKEMLNTLLENKR